MSKRFLILLLIFLAACSTPEPPPPTPGEIVSSMTATMDAVNSFHFVIAYEGSPAYVDPQETLSFRSAEGDYLAPDRARAEVKVAFPGLVTAVNVISIGPVQWQTNPLTGAWEELPPNWGFNPSVLFQEGVGLPTILAADLADVALLGEETLADRPDDPLYHLSGTVAGERLFEMSGELIGPETAVVEMWVEKETLRLVRILLEEPGEEEPDVWQVDFTQYEQDITIEPPA